MLANLVNHLDIQEKKFKEIKGIVGDEETIRAMTEVDLQNLPYLKTIILETLRSGILWWVLFPHML